MLFGLVSFCEGVDVVGDVLSVVVIDKLFFVVLDDLVFEVCLDVICCDGGNLFCDE